MKARRGHKSRAGLDEAAGHERTLSDRVTAIPIAQLLGFLPEVEGLPDWADVAAHFERLCLAQRADEAGLLVSAHGA